MSLSPPWGPAPQLWLGAGLTADTVQVRRLLVESRQDPISHTEAKKKFVRIMEDVILSDKVRLPRPYSCMWCLCVCVAVSVWVAPQLVVRAVLQCLSFLTESLEDMGVPAAPSVQAGKNLYDRLALERTQVELARRVTDVNKFLVELKQMMEVAKHEEAEITTELRAQVQGVLVRNTRDALHIVRPLQMQQHTLVIMYVVHILRACEASVAHLVGGVLQHGDSPRLVGVRRA